MTLADFASFAVALAVAAAVPGPGIAALVAQALGTGFRRTLPMIGGLIVGDLVYMGAAVVGLAALAATFGTLFLIVRWLGAAYLVYLAVRLWRARPEGAEASVAGNPAQPVRTFLAGLAVTLGNPKVMVFYLALVPALIDLRRITGVDFAVMTVIVFADLMLVLGLYVVLADRARVLIARPGAQRIANRVAGATMAGAAVAVVAR
jgi:threonine/homoserine/homoserine lactone efflux protein